MSQTEQARQATTWAAGTLTNNGALLHPTNNGWDVELANGSWIACNDWRELCAAAHAVQLLA